MTTQTLQTTLQDIPCDRLKGVGPKVAEHLEKLAVRSVQDILFHLPLRYEDRTRVTPIRAGRVGQRVVVQGVLEHAEVIMRKKPQLVGTLRDGSGFLTLRFFNFSAAQKNRFTVGNRYVCFGELRFGSSGVEMVHPEYRLVGKDQAITLSDTLTPIYPTTEGLQQRTWLQLTDQALDYLGQGLVLEEMLPTPVLEKLQLPGLREALSYVHRPPPDANQAKLLQGNHVMQQRLIFEELLAHRLALLRLRKTLQEYKATPLGFNHGSPACTGDDVVAARHDRGIDSSSHLFARFIASLPFALTNAQARVIEEIQQDLVHTYPMLRLLQGDVGSGKTVVAAAAVIQAITNDTQAAVMAPTEILAEQHYQSFSEWFEPLGINVALLTSSVKTKARRDIVERIASGEIHVIIGTHAIFQKDVTFSRLGLMVVDEQHRFGVHQRLALREKGNFQDHYPHQLIMTATPIPRTLAMSFYADLDCSVIDELPKGRKPIQTIVLPNQKRVHVIERIQAVCKEGRQVYWVCPLIEESEVLQCQAAEASFALLKDQLPELTIGLVHGRLKPQEKADVMQAFKAGSIHVLVATTVIEVGVNVPNASLMVIENAERLGLSQLHQLRGRVGRGSLESFCVLMYQLPLSETAKSRLAIMRETNDGFKIAERDLELRGPGEVLGTRQTGAMVLRIADILRDKALLPFVQQAADDIQRECPEITPSLIARWLGDNEQFGAV